NPTLLEKYATPTEGLDGRNVVADEQHRLTAVTHLLHFAYALAMKLSIANRQHLVDQENFWFEMGRDSECQTDVHSARVALDGGFKELLDLREGDNLVELAIDLPSRHPQNGTVEIDVLPPGQLGMESRPHLQQAAQAAAHLRPAGARLSN